MKHHIYHHNDIDGHASGALIAIKLVNEGVNRKDIIFYRMQYGMEFNDSLVNYKEDHIYMVDFSLQPLEKMEKLLAYRNFTWIDHHKTSIEWYDSRTREEKENDNAKIIILDDKRAACGLIWELYFKGYNRFIHMCDSYDTWNKESPFSWDTEILPLQIYLGTIETRPEKNIAFWRCVTNNGFNFDGWIKLGKTLKNFNDKRQADLVKSHGYEAYLCGHKAFVLNSSEAGSMQFESAIDVDKYELLVSYREHKGEYWIVNLYSTNPKIDCGAIAKKLGAEGPFKSGGGHPGAAGFQTDGKHILSLFIKTPENISAGNGLVTNKEFGWARSCGVAK